MDILIKGMEMPEAKETFLRIDDKGNVKVYGNPTESYKAVSIPPHGRLIDADALMHDTDSIVHKTMLFGGQYVYSEDAIKNASTIIESEGER